MYLCSRIAGLRQTGEPECRDGQPFGFGPSTVKVNANPVHQDNFFRTTNSPQETKVSYPFFFFSDTNLTSTVESD